MSVKVTADSGILWVEINRPEAMNALDLPAFEALARAWGRLEEDAALSVAVVTGAGDRAFCAGADLKSAVPAIREHGDLELTNRALLVDNPPTKPVVAAVNGHCVGAGCILLLGTDLRLASPTATFGLTAVPLGVYAPHAAPLLSAQVPYGVAARMLLLGERLAAAEAYAAGLVSEVQPQEALHRRARSIATQLAGFDQTTLRAFKGVLSAGRSGNSTRAWEIDRANSQAFARRGLKPPKPSPDQENRRCV